MSGFCGLRDMHIRFGLCTSCSHFFTSERHKISCRRHVLIAIHWFLLSRRVFFQYSNAFDRSIFQECICPRAVEGFTARAVIITDRRLL